MKVSKTVENNKFFVCCMGAFYFIYIAAGEVFGIFILTCFGVRSDFMHCCLKKY